MFMGGWDSDSGGLTLEILTTKIYSQMTETQEGGGGAEHLRAKVLNQQALTLEDGVMVAEGSKGKSPSPDGKSNLPGTDRC